MIHAYFDGHQGVISTLGKVWFLALKRWQRAELSEQ